MRTYAQLTTSFVVFCNRVGVDESISFWGGSEVIAPTGEALFTAPFFEEGLFTVDVSLADVRRERVALPLLRDERPGAGRSASCRGSSPSGPASPRLDRRRRRRARPRRRARATRSRGRSASSRGARRTPTARPHAATADVAERTAVTARCSSCRPSSRSTPTSPAGSSASSSAASSARRASSGSSSGLSGGIDSALVAYLSAEAIGAEQLLCVLMPYRTSSPASRADAEEVVRRLGCRERGRRHQPDGRRLLRRRPGRDAAPARQLHGPPADGGPVRPLGHVGRARRRDRQQDRVADRLHDAVRRQRLRVQPDRRPLQEPGPPDRGRRSACRRRSSEGAVGRPLAGPDRRDRGGLQLSGPRPAAVLADRQAALDRGDGRARASTGRWSSGSTGWSRPPSSSARSRRSRSSGRGRPASTTSTRGAGRAPRAGERAATRAAGCSSSRRRSGTSATSRCARSRCSGRCR